MPAAPSPIAPAAPAPGTSNEDLAALLYPAAPTSASAAPVAADPDHDPEFDGPLAAAPADEPAAEATDPAPAAEDDAAVAEPAADADPAIEPKPAAAPEAETPVVRELREKVATLEQQAALLGELQEQLATAAPVTADDPLADVATEAELTARERKAYELRRWLVGHRDGGAMPDGKGGTLEISPEKRDALLAETDELVLRQLPARRQFIARQRTYEAEARRAHPAIAQPQSELSLRVAAALRAYPALQTMPEARLFLADALAHAGLRTRGAAAARPPATPSRPPPRTEAAPRVAARVPATAQRAEKALERLQQTGRDDDNVALASLLGVPARRAA